MKKKKEGSGTAGISNPNEPPQPPSSLQVSRNEAAPVASACSSSTAIRARRTTDGSRGCKKSCGGRGFDVFVPAMPSPNSPAQNKWVEKIALLADEPTRHDFFVAIRWAASRFCAF